MYVGQAIVAGSGYFLVMGMTRGLAFDTICSMCPACKLDPETGTWQHWVTREYSGPKKVDAQYSHGFVTWWASFLWPIAFPYLLGRLLDRHVRADRRRRMELLEANHQRALLRIVTEESDALDEQLKMLEKADESEDRSGSD